MELMIKQGYKQTEVGLIPEDWNIKLIGDLTSKIGDGIHSTPSYNSSGNYYFINGNNLKNGEIIIDESTKKVDFNEFKKHQRDIDELTILLSINGTIGNVAFYKNEKVVLGKSAAYINLKKQVSKEYVFYKLKTKSVLLFFQNNLTGSTIKNLGLGTIRNTPISIPPTLTEQKAIATALSDVDALISSLEQTITKKKAIKQGAMQQLLIPPHKGGKRLPGFEGEWEYLPIELVADCLDNLRVPLNGEQRNKMNGDIPYCGANGVVDYVDDYVIDDDIILMAEDGGYFDEYKTRHIAYRMIGKCWVNNHAHILKAKKHINQGYLFYTLVHKNILDYINGGTRAKLNKSEMESWFPSSQNEQKAIAQILSDMDVEITQLETKKEKYQAIKQGMMQELLTGKTRLI